MNPPFISVVITTWLEKNKTYLDAALASIKNLNYPKDRMQVILVTPKWYRPEFEGVITMNPYEDNRHYYNGEGLNYGIKHADPRAEYYFILNDDVILTKNCLKNMVEASQGKLVANAISPNENGLDYFFHFGFWKGGILNMAPERFTRFENIKGTTEDLMNAESLYNQGLIFRKYLFLYATLIPRSVWDEVGILDEGFRTGPDDIDYSIRCMQKGIRLISVMNAVIWHFGGVTSSETIDKTLRESNAKYFKEKWGIEQNQVF